jgi:hypothetical protein
VTPAAGQYRLAQGQRRHTERQADLDGPLGPRCDRQIAQSLPLGPLHAVRAQVKRIAVVVVDAAARVDRVDRDLDASGARQFVRPLIVVLEFDHIHIFAII